MLSTQNTQKSKHTNIRMSVLIKVWAAATFILVMVLLTYSQAASSSLSYVTTALEQSEWTTTTTVTIDTNEQMAQASEDVELPTGDKASIINVLHSIQIFLVINSMCVIGMFFFCMCIVLLLYSDIAKRQKGNDKTQRRG